MEKEQNISDQLDIALNEAPRGIAGWLIIPAIGLILSPVKSIVMLIMGISAIQSLTPELIGDMRFWLLCLIDVAMIIAAIVVAIFFFKGLRIAIRAIIILMIASIVATIIEAFLNISMFGEADFETIKPIIHTCVFGAIWIPYFLKSKEQKIHL